MDTNHTIRFTWVVLFIAIGIVGMKGDEIGNGTANYQSNTTSLALQGNEDTGGRNKTYNEVEINKKNRYNGAYYRRGGGGGGGGGGE